MSYFLYSRVIVCILVLYSRNTLPVFGFTIDLGPDKHLCKPASLILDAIYTGPGVSYEWRKNGQVLSGETASTLLVNQPGSYQVTVTDPANPPAQTDEIVITSEVPVPVATSTSCFSPPSSVTLSVNFATGDPFRWYAEETGGSVLSSSNSYTTPVLSSTTVYYVENSSIRTSFLIPAIANNGFTNYIATPNPAAPNDYLNFDVLTTFLLKSIRVYVPCDGSSFITLEISNPSTGFLQSYTTSHSCLGDGDQFAVQINATLPAANGYRIRRTAGFSTGYYAGTPGVNLYPRIYNSNTQAPMFHNNLMRLTGYTSPTAMPPFFNWEISVASTCARVPVIAYACSALPVNLVSFETIPKRNSVLLTWSTASEENHRSFRIERSEDGNQFIPIGSISGRGSAENITSYSYTDHPGNSCVYYRLVYIDIEDRESYSSIRHACMEADPFLSWLPANPCEDFIMLPPFESETPYQLEIIQAQGEKIYESSGSNLPESISCHEWKSGLYFLCITKIQGERHWYKIVVSR